MGKITNSRKYASVRRHRERNKLFAVYKEGDLIQLIGDPALGNKIKLRAISKNEEGKFCYRDKRINWYRLQVIGGGNFYTVFSIGKIGLYLGRYDGGAVVLIDECFYHVPINNVKKILGEKEYE